MGYEAKATCLDCGEIFYFRNGGGFRFHLVRCDKCGMSKSISKNHEALNPKNVRKSDIPKLIDGRNSDMEELAGKCDCGGQYTLDAPPRCSSCHSTRIEEDINYGGMMYD